jgi:hypothetical protein
MQLSWDNNADMSCWMRFFKGAVVQINDTDYCVDAFDSGGITVTPSDENGERIVSASPLSIPWPMIEQLHIY